MNDYYKMFISNTSSYCIDEKNDCLYRIQAQIELMKKMPEIKHCSFKLSTITSLSCGGHKFYLGGF